VAFEPSSVLRVPGEIRWRVEEPPVLDGSMPAMGSYAE
jgi:hypothetical protein